MDCKLYVYEMVVVLQRDEGKKVKMDKWKNSTNRQGQVDGLLIRTMLVAEDMDKHPWNTFLIPQNRKT